MIAVRRLDFINSGGDRIRTGRVRLEPGGSAYVITADFLPLADNGLGAWTLTLSTTSTPGASGGTVIASSLLLRDRTDCLAGVVSPVRPPGGIVPYNPASREEPRRYAFEREGWSLYYIPGGYNPADFAISSAAG